MLLYISIAVVIVGALVNPYINRLDDASIWLSKAIASVNEDDFSSRTLKKLNWGTRLALRTGGSWWFSTLEFIIPLLLFVGVGLGFFYAWWAGILAFVLYIFFYGIGQYSNLFSKRADYYIMFYMTRLMKRAANYAKNNDFIRADAAKELSDELKELLPIYLDTFIQVPDTKTAKACPTGDKYYLYDLYHGLDTKQT